MRRQPLGAQINIQLHFRRKRGICKEMKTVKVTTDNKVSIIEVNFGDFKSIQQAIGGSFEIVRTQLMADYFGTPGIVMLVDEEGLIKQLPMNASAFYGTIKHGNPIVGDLIFGSISGEDITAPLNPEAMMERLLNAFIGLKRVERRAR